MFYEQDVKDDGDKENPPQHFPAENAHGPLNNLPRSGTREFSQFARLSVCEREVAALVCQGESNKEIAAHLGKSVLTVKTQLQSIYGKLGQVGRGKLIALLFER